MATTQELATQGVVVGMKALTGDVQPRVDIDTLLIEKPDTFNLMLQALALMQKNPNLLGYYSIAGIHGFPSTSWDGVLNEFSSKGANFGGYCPHGRMIFPTWHRPFLMLLEQTIYQNMVEIAGKYDQPHRDRYQLAAKAFRLPYLDYFRPRDDRGVKWPGPREDQWFKYDFRLPDVFNEPRINVKLAPSDTIKEIDNPLYAYRFKTETGQLPQGDWATTRGRFSTSQTLRWPTSTTQTEHDLPALSESLNKARQATITTFFDLITTAPYATLASVASDRLLATGDLTSFEKLDETKTKIVGSGSIEGFHGNYHNFIGGKGHMSDISVAAFDPVFWFHHAQIDRVWSLWQAFHPDVWFPKTTRPNQKSENEKDLLPFYRQRSGPGKGKFYTSDDTKNTEDLGYTYDDLVGWKKGDKTDALLKKLKAKYDWQRVKPDDPTVTAPKKTSVLPSYAKVHASYFFTGLSKPKTTSQPVPQPRSMKLHIVQSLNIAPPPAPAPVAMMMSMSMSMANTVPPVAESSVAAPSPPVAPVVTKKIDPVFDREWYVDSSVQRSAGHGPFTIYFFLAKPGEVPSADADSNVLARSPFLAGINHMFVASSDACDNCGDLEALGQISSDTTPITPLLLTYLELPEGNGLESLRPEHVKPFLIKYLRWRVVFKSGEMHDPRDLAEHSSFKIGVSAKVYHDDGTKTYEDYPEIVKAITDNASETAGA
ncbi:hypothetical protein QBC47DRAFT_430447 [Echria macrotheca]|uniref:tyrosinase n=1 Tax=Echria macrotheca TaxID=438768 RepID=A0AAJ0BD24_9PEZI|nr:hypothetical protein QBC47DRAFT_430447 [Echria macrotheca]